MPDLIAPSLGKLRRAARRLVERDRPVILMYHWVARLAHDPWHLAVSPDRFAEQIEALVQFRHVVPLPWLVAQLAQGRVPRNAAVVTFDDGYADVLGAARPVLERHSCPATVFLMTGAIEMTAASGGTNCQACFSNRLLCRLNSGLTSLVTLTVGEPAGNWRPTGVATVQSSCASSSTTSFGSCCVLSILSRDRTLSSGFAPGLAPRSGLNRCAGHSPQRRSIGWVRLVSSISAPLPGSLPPSP